MAASATNELPIQGAEPQPETKKVTALNYDAEAVSRLVRRGILEPAHEGPPQFELTMPYVRHLSGVDSTPESSRPE